MSVPSQIHINAGRWRSRKIDFPDNSGLRPTPNRVRETLFNWLAPTIQGANCLDCFAGSGALGFEALSRGASHVLMIDAHTDVIASLKACAQKLETTDADIIHGLFPQHLPKTLAKFDIVFLDPPFNQNLIGPACEYLNDHDLLSKDALIYIEAEKDITELATPKHWKILKEKVAGDVRYFLVQSTTTIYS